MRKPQLYYFLLCTALLVMASVCCFAQAQPDTNAGNLFKTPPPEQTDTVKEAVHAFPVITTDTTKLTKADSIKASHKPKVFQPNPKKAGLYSAIFPGLGQLYNRQYWKIPVVYAVLGVAGYFIVTNQSKYQEYRKAYIGRLTGDLSNETANTRLYSSAGDLKTLQDGYKKYLDVTVLLTGVGYTLQILDAVVFAHLKNFDISRDISMRMKPLAMPNGDAGMGLVLNLKPRTTHNLPKTMLSPF